jgi:hypothetical protein
MTPSSNRDPDSMPDWRDPFAEPNTIPGGWDVSGLIAKNTDVPADDKQTSASGTNALPGRVLLSLN